MITYPNCGICGMQITTANTGLAIYLANTEFQIRNTCPECTKALRQFIEERKAKFMLERIEAFKNILSPEIKSITAIEKEIDMNEVRKYIPNLNLPSFKLDTTRPIEEEDL